MRTRSPRRSRRVPMAVAWGDRRLVEAVAAFCEGPSIRSFVRSSRSSRSWSVFLLRAIQCNAILSVSVQRYGCCALGICNVREGICAHVIIPYVQRQSLFFSLWGQTIIAGTQKNPPRLGAHFFCRTEKQWEKFSALQITRLRRMCLTTACSILRGGDSSKIS